MKWKIILCTFFLIAAAAVITLDLSPILNICSNLNIESTFDFGTLLLDGGFMPLGGGDPVPGGGIPR